MKETVPLLLLLAALGCSTSSGPLAQLDTKRVREIAARHIQENPETVTVPVERMDCQGVEAYFTGGQPQGVLITVIYEDTSSHKVLRRNDKGEPTRESITVVRVTFNGSVTSFVVNEVTQEFDSPEW